MKKQEELKKAHNKNIIDFLNESQEHADQV